MDPIKSTIHSTCRHVDPSQSDVFDNAVDGRDDLVLGGDEADVLEAAALARRILLLLVFSSVFARLRPLRVSGS